MCNYEVESFANAIVAMQIMKDDLNNQDDVQSHDIWLHAVDNNFCIHVNIFKKGYIENCQVTYGVGVIDGNAYNQ